MYGLRSSRRPDKTLRRSQGCRERQTAGFRERGRQGHDRRHSDRRTRQIRTRPARRRDDAGGQLRGLRHAGGGDQGAPAHRRLPSEILPQNGRGRRDRIPGHQEADLHRIVRQTQDRGPEHGRRDGREPHARRQGGGRLGAERLGNVRRGPQSPHPRRHVDQRRQQAAVGSGRHGARGRRGHLQRPAFERRPHHAARLLGGGHQRFGHRDLRHPEGRRRNGALRRPRHERRDRHHHQAGKTGSPDHHLQRQLHAADQAPLFAVQHHELLRPDVGLLRNGAQGAARTRHRELRELGRLRHHVQPDQRLQRQQRQIRAGEHAAGAPRLPDEVRQGQHRLVRQAVHLQPHARALAQHLVRLREVAHLRLDRLPGRQRLEHRGQGEPLHGQFPQRFRRQQQNPHVGSGRGIAAPAGRPRFVHPPVRRGDGQLLARLRHQPLQLRAQHQPRPAPLRRRGQPGVHHDELRSCATTSST